MADPAPLDSFLAKWHARWPEWKVAIVFVPAAQRVSALAWFALLQEFTDAAWGGSEATPGLAKLAWWQEELRGWASGARRHPLGMRLQAQSAPWKVLSEALSGLPASRERPRDAADAIATLLPFAQVLAACEAGLFVPMRAAESVTTEAGADIAVALLGERLLQHPQQAVPMQLLARHGDGAGEDAAKRAWAEALLQRRPDACGVAPRRIHAALLRARLQRLSASGIDAPLPSWRVPFTAWNAARGV